MDCQKKGLNAFSLRWLALILMLISHAGYVLGKLVHPAVFYGMYCVGRLAFPIFAFQIAQGCNHTSNFGRYALRLFLFGLLSEIPFNMMKQGMGSFFAPNYQNVMFTLLLGLLTLRLLLWARQRTLWHKLAAVAVFAVAYVAAEGLKLDYGGLGVTTVVMFGLSADLQHSTLIQIICLTLINGAMVLESGSLLYATQLLAVLAMIPICLYNGKLGPKNKPLQYAAYLFYPAHISILVVLRYVLVKLAL